MSLSDIFSTITVVLLALAVVLTIGSAMWAFRADPRRPERFVATGVFALAAVIAVVALVSVP